MSEQREHGMQMGSRKFRASGYGMIQVSEIILSHPEAKPGTAGWVNRFTLITSEETAEKWPTISSAYSEGLLDSEGNWIADFQEPTEDNPTKF